MRKIFGITSCELFAEIDNQLIAKTLGKNKDINQSKKFYLLNNNNFGLIFDIIMDFKSGVENGTSIVCTLPPHEHLTSFRLL